MNKFISAFYQKIKDIAFVYKDQNGGADKTQNQLLNEMVAKGAKSQMLLRNSSFQDAFQQTYLALVVQEDEIDPMDPKGQEKAENLRLQRRLLRQVIGVMDTQVAQMEEAQRFSNEVQHETE